MAQSNIIDQIEQAQIKARDDHVRKETDSLKDYTNQAGIIKDYENIATNETKEIRYYPVWFRRLYAVGAIGLMLAGVSGCGGRSVSGQENPNPNSGQEVVTETKEEITERTIVEALPTVEELEISAELVSNPEELAEVIIERFDEWESSGSNEDILQAKVYEHDESFIIDSDYMKAFAYKIGDRFNPIYVEALFVDNPSEDLSEMIDHYSEFNNEHAWSYTRTSFREEGDEEPYIMDLTMQSLDEFIDNGDGSYNLVITYMVEDNSEYNRIAETYTNGNIVDGLGVMDLTLESQDGVLKINSFKQYAK